GFGVMSRRVSMARAEFSQAGRWGWGKIVLSDTLAADVPAIVTYRGALGVPVIFDVFPSHVVMKHEAGGAYLSAVFRVDGDRMLGTLRGRRTPIGLSRERGAAGVAAGCGIAGALWERRPPPRPRGDRRTTRRRPRRRRCDGSPDR